MAIPVGDRLRRWRQCRGLTLLQLKEETGIPRASLCRMETGKQPVKHDDLETICRSFGISVAEFYAILPREGITAAALSAGR